MFGWLVLAILIFIVTLLMFIGKWFDTPFISDIMETVYSFANLGLMIGSLIIINVIILNW
jgi:hypothetical protein